MKFIKQNCTPQDADDKSLPTTCFLVTYKENGITYYDLVMASKQVDIFDYYYDKYREGFITMKQAEGRANPKVWTPPK